MARQTTCLERAEADRAAAPAAHGVGADEHVDDRAVEPRDHDVRRVDVVLLGVQEDQVECHEAACPDRDGRVGGGGGRVVIVKPQLAARAQQRGVERNLARARVNTAANREQAASSPYDVDK